MGRCRPCHCDSAFLRGTSITPLLAWLLTLHALILIYGGWHTYERVPLGEWMQSTFGWERNHYDRIGHFAQGFIPAVLIREVLLRHEVVHGRGGWRDRVCRMHGLYRSIRNPRICCSALFWWRLGCLPRFAGHMGRAVGHGLLWHGDPPLHHDFSQDPSQAAGFHDNSPSYRVTHIQESA